jgi:hypothetical protein
MLLGVCVMMMMMMIMEKLIQHHVPKDLNIHFLFGSGYVCKIVESKCLLCHGMFSCLSFSPSAWNNSAPSGGVFIIFNMSIY